MEEGQFCPGGEMDEGIVRQSYPGGETGGEIVEEGKLIVIQSYRGEEMEGEIAEEGIVMQSYRGEETEEEMVKEEMVEEGAVEASL
jgi:hypothetical protein